MSVVIEDKTDRLTLTHYANVSEDTSESVKRTRGKIVNEKEEVVCSSYGYTPEYTVKVDHNKYKSYLTDLSECIIYRSEEGSLLRLFFNDNKWNLSTHKRIDAFLSRWSSSKTFGEWFTIALEYFFLQGEGKGTITSENKDELYDCFCDTLDRTLVYTFLLRTNADTKISCKSPEHPTIYFTGAFKDEKRVKDITIQIPTPLQVKFTTVEELEEYVTSLDPYEHQGVIAILPDESTLKIMHPTTMTSKAIRGSEPDIRAAYFRIRKSTDDILLFTQLFPNVDTKYIESQLYYMVKYLHSMYVRRYIKKQYTVVHPVLFSVMYIAHNWHVLDRVNNIVTLDKMMDIIDEQPHYKMFRLFNEYINQKKSL
jgi:hypothetical protein